MNRALPFPLPPEWSGFIPPQPIIRAETRNDTGLVSSELKWNEDWLIGLEKFIRSVIQDELKQTNAATIGKHLIDGMVASVTKAIDADNLPHVY